MLLPEIKCSTHHFWPIKLRLTEKYSLGKTKFGEAHLGNIRNVESEKGAKMVCFMACVLDMHWFYLYFMYSYYNVIEVFVFFQVPLAYGVCVFSYSSCFVQLLCSSKNSLFSTSSLMFRYARVFTALRREPMAPFGRARIVKLEMSWPSNRWARHTVWCNKTEKHSLVIGDDCFCRLVCTWQMAWNGVQTWCVETTSWGVHKLSQACRQWGKLPTSTG